MTHIVIMASMALLIIFLWTQSAENWRPFAWYGYPGDTPGSVGYQARGEWCGVVKATRDDQEIMPLSGMKLPCLRRRNRSL